MLSEKKISFEVTVRQCWLIILRKVEEHSIVPLATSKYGEVTIKVASHVLDNTGFACYFSGVEIGNNSGVVREFSGFFNSLSGDGWIEEIPSVPPPIFMELRRLIKATATSYASA